MPDVLLYDNAASEYAGGVEKYKTQIILYSHGTHFWMSPAVFTSTCVIDIKYFPFDRQVIFGEFWDFWRDILDFVPSRFIGLSVILGFVFQGSSDFL